MRLSFNFSGSKEINVLGIMSGTSCDGIDFALISVKMMDEKPVYSVLKTIVTEFPNSVKSSIERIIQSQKTEMNILTDLLYKLSELTVNTIQNIKQDFQIDLIGVHGQTLFHHGKKSQTFQLVSSQLISKQTGIPTVSDFRTGDTALGGEGAPLVSFFDFMCWNKPDINQLILNIGGISNGTYLPKNVTKEEVYSFDFGPGNTFIDFCSKKYFDVNYDKNGEFSHKGRVDEGLVLKWTKSEPYFKLKFPKSSGREFFNQNYLNKLISDCEIKQLDKYDIIATVSAFTVDSILFQLNYFDMSVDETFISGGGAFNIFLKNRFTQKGFTLSKVDKETIEFKEAIIFGLLAYYFIREEPAHLISVTGASQKTVLGSFSW
jgi:anhydro-N-acetylmuramic acid kinase